MSRKPSHLAIPIVLLVLSSGAGAQELKSAHYKRAARVPIAPPRPASFSDVAEVEPNGSADDAQALSCGDALRPASLTNTAARDTDWIMFTADAGQLITFATSSDGLDQTDTVIQLLASDGATSLALNDDNGSSPFSLINAFVAPYTGVYYGTIRGFQGAQGAYRADLTCAAAPTVPGNDQCDGAIAIGCGPIALSGNSLAATDDYDLCPGSPICEASCTGFDSPGRDVVFRIDVPAPGLVLDVTYALEPAGADASIYLVTDCAQPSSSCVAGSDSDVGEPTETLVYTFATAGTYYLILDAFSPNGGGAWTLNGSLSCAVSTKPLTWGQLKMRYR